MAAPDGRIRRMVPSDDKEVRFIIGKAAMEPLTTANRLGELPTRSSLLVMHSVFIYSLHTSHNDSHMDRPFVHIHPVHELVAGSCCTWTVCVSQSFACIRECSCSYTRPRRLVSLAVLARVFWEGDSSIRFNRPYFDKQIHEVLRRPDMIDVVAHYSRAPSSALWVLEFKDKVIALVAFDAQGHSTALVRHFYIDEQYIPSHVQDDLLSHAVKYAFESNPELERITAPDSPLTPHLRRSLRAVGFQLDTNAATETVGVFRWKFGMRMLDRAKWENAQTEN